MQALAQKSVFGTRVANVTRVNARKPVSVVVRAAAEKAQVNDRDELYCDFKAWKGRKACLDEHNEGNQEDDLVYWRFKGNPWLEKPDIGYINAKAPLISQKIQDFSHFSDDFFDLDIIPPFP